MATKNEQFFIDLGKGASWAAGVAFQRSNPLPLDKYSVFASETDALNYATTNAVAYPGQIVAYVDGDKMAVCVLAQNADGSALELQSIGGAIGDYETAAADTLPQKKAIYDEAGENVVGYEVKWVPISAIVEGDGNTTYTFGKEEDKTLVITPYDEGVAGEASKVTFDFLTTAEVNALIEEAKKYADDNDANDNTTYAISYDTYDIPTGEGEETVSKKAIRLLGSDGVASYVDVADFLKDSVLEGVDYNAENNTLTFTWNTLDEDGNKVTTEVELTDMLSPYTAGNGISIIEQVISAKVKDDDKYIEVTADGIASKGIDEAISAAIEAENLAQYTTEDEVKAIAYTKSEVYTKSETDTKIDEKIASVTGGESAADVKLALESYRDALNKEVWGDDAGSWTTSTTEDGKTVVTYTPQYGNVSRIDSLETELGTYKVKDVKASTNAKVTVTVDENKVATVDDSALVELITTAQTKANEAAGKADTNAQNITAINESLTNNYVSNTSLNSTLADYLTGEQVSDTYLTKTEAGQTYLTKTDASDTYVSKNTADASYAPRGEFETLKNTAALAANVYTKEEANGLLDNKADKSSVYTKTEIGTIESGKTLVDMINEAADTTALEARVKANEDAIAAIDFVDEDELAAAIKVETDRADAEEKRLAGLIEQNTKDIAGNTAVINSILGNEDETDLNSIAELADWINKHGEEAAGMAEAITANEKAIETINDVTIPAAIASANSYTDSAIAALGMANYKVKDVDGTTLQVSEAGVASVKAVSTDSLVQGTDELVLCGGTAAGANA